MFKVHREFPINNKALSQDVHPEHDNSIHSTNKMDTAYERNIFIIQGCAYTCCKFLLLSKPQDKSPESLQQWRRILSRWIQDNRQINEVESRR